MMRLLMTSRVFRVMRISASTLRCSKYAARSSAAALTFSDCGLRGAVDGRDLCPDRDLPRLPTDPAVPRDTHELPVGLTSRLTSCLSPDIMMGKYNDV